MNTFRSRPVLIVFSVLAGGQVLTAGATLGELLGARTAALLVLLVAAAQAALTFYVQGRVTPNVAVAARVEDGQLVAGPAAAQPDGAPVRVL